MNRSRPMSRIILAALALTLGLVLCASAQTSAELRETARKKSAEVGDAVVTLKTVISIKYSYGGYGSDEREVKSEALGTVVSPEGLIVCSLSEIDPTQLWKRMMGSQMDDEMNFESNLKDLQILLANNKEIPATVVLRDNDLDLAVIRPLEKPEQAMTHVDLAKAAEAKLLDPIVVLARMGALGNRQVRLMVDEIQAAIVKPRPFFIPSEAVSMACTGAPVFDAQGRLLGILLMRAVRGSADDSQTQQQRNVSIIVLPAVDVQEVVAQAGRVEAESKQTEESEKTEEKPAETKEDAE